MILHRAPPSSRSVTSTSQTPFAVVDMALRVFTLPSYCSVTSSYRSTGAGQIWAQLGSSLVRIRTPSDALKISLCPASSPLAARPRSRSKATGSEEEDGKFVDLGPALLEPYGPPALLLLGINEAERRRVEEAMEGIGAGFVHVAPVTKTMLEELSLWDAVNTAAASAQAVSIPEPHSSDVLQNSAPLASAPQFLVPGHSLLADVSPSSTAPVVSSVAVCFLSGLTGEECMQLVDMLHQVLPHLADEGRLACAAMLPNFAHRPLRELVGDILGDHASVASQQGLPS